MGIICKQRFNVNMKRRKIRAFIVYFFCMLPCCIKAQLNKGNKSSHLCAPGVSGMAPGKGLEIFHEYLPGYQLASPVSSQSVQPIRDYVNYSTLWGVKLKIPVLLKPQTKILLDTKYSKQRFNFQNQEILDNPFHEELGAKSLQNFRLGAIISHSIDESHYWAGRVAVSYNGSDFDEIYPGVESTNMSAIFLYGIKKHAHKEWGVGLAQALQFGQYRAYPVFMYNHTFSDKWGLEMLLPKEAYIRHNFSKSLISRAGLSLAGNNYNLVSGEESQREWIQLQQNFVRLELEVEKKVAPMVWLSLQTGFLEPVSWRYTTIDTDTPLVGNMGRSFYTRAAISLRLPQ